MGTVYVLKAEALHPVRIGVGISDNRFTEVLSGDLKVGDRVVVGESAPGDATQTPSTLRMRMF
jgi:HlyD family secretion protein